MSNPTVDAQAPLATLTSTRETFVALRERGFWSQPAYPDKKRPFGKGWGLSRADDERWRNARRCMRQEPNVGICLGPERGPGGEWLIDIEGDGPQAEESRATLFGGEQVETLGWTATRGRHELLTVDPARIMVLLRRLKACEVKDKRRPAGVYKSPDKLPGLELLVGGYKSDGIVKQVQSIVPPSKGTDGKPRVWTGP
jgi:hypothetical protein